ncbi:CD1375 family protein [Brevibacillus agri]|nr:CD1375 family protein [Brevibacillus agri]
MAVIYATLIVKGYKTICEVPKTIRNDVRQVLIQLDAGHLAEPTCADETA